MMKKIILLASLIIFFLSSCEKFLDEKRDKKLTVIQNLADLQALLNSTSTGGADGISGEISSDDYFVTDADYNSLSYLTEKRKYIWEKDNLFEIGSDGNDWNAIYKLIYLCNIVLENLQKIERNPQNAAVFDDIKGQAYLLRGKSIYNAIQIWSLGYNPLTAMTDAGVVLRETTDFNIPSVRSNLAESYKFAKDDMRRASELLSPVFIHASRPCRQAALGYLARLSLAMGDFEEALKYSNACLDIKAQLLDFNSQVSTKTYPIDLFNSEVVFLSTPASLQITNNTRAKIVPELYNSYDNNDLRKVLFFRDNNNGTFSFRGSYMGSQPVFSGIAIDEQLLIRAECNARLSNKQKALDDINTLLVKRYRNGFYVPYAISDVPSVLDLVLRERRKELLMRSLRWTDLKRFNVLGAGIDLVRTVNGQTYKLNSNSPRYALEIPVDIIALSNIPQNVR